MGAKMIVAVAAVAATLLVSCTPKRAEAPLAPCDVATGTGTSTSRHVALARADRALRTQTLDARGDLVSTGVRRVRVIGTRRTCEPYALTASLVTCKVQARLCGRY